MHYSTVSLSYHMAASLSYQNTMVALRYYILYDSMIRLLHYSNIFVCRCMHWWLFVYNMWCFCCICMRMYLLACICMYSYVCAYVFACMCMYLHAFTNPAKPESMLTKCQFSNFIEFPQYTSHAICTLTVPRSPEPGTVRVHSSGHTHNNPHGPPRPRNPNN